MSLLRGIYRNYVRLESALIEPLVTLALAMWARRTAFICLGVIGFLAWKAILDPTLWFAVAALFVLLVLAVLDLRRHPPSSAAEDASRGGARAVVAGMLRGLVRGAAFVCVALVSIRAYQPQLFDRLPRPWATGGNSAIVTPQGGGAARVAPGPAPTSAPTPAPLLANAAAPPPASAPAAGSDQRQRARAPIVPRPSPGSGRSSKEAADALEQERQRAAAQELERQRAAEEEAARRVAAEAAQARQRQQEQEQLLREQDALRARAKGKIRKVVLDTTDGPGGSLDVSVDFDVSGMKDVEGLLAVSFEVRRGRDPYAPLQWSDGTGPGPATVSKPYTPRSAESTFRTFRLALPFSRFVFQSGETRFRATVSLRSGGPGTKGTALDTKTKDIILVKK